MFLVVLENSLLEQMVQNGFTNFCILETNPFVLKLFTQYLVNGFHMRSKGKEFVIHH